MYFTGWIPYNYNLGTNQLTYVAGLQSQNHYSYDTNGNVDKMGTWNTINYDFRNLPYYMSNDNSSHIMKFLYDAQGNRIYKYKYDLGYETHTYYIRDANGRTIAVYGQDGGFKFINLYGLDLIGKVY